MITDVNDVFGTITGYGPAGLPYAEPYPWAIDAAQEPDLGQLYSRVHGEALAAEQGRYTMPIRHRDGRQRWVASIVRAIPGWGRPGQVLVGTLRDVTDEHNAAAREAAVSRLATGLAARPTSARYSPPPWPRCGRPLGPGGPSRPSGRRTRRYWWPASRRPAAGPRWTPPRAAGWRRPGSTRFRTWRSKRAAAASRPASPARLAAGGGDAAIWLDRGARGPLTLEDRVLFGVLSAHLGNALARAIHYEQARDLAVALQHSVLGQTALPAGFGVRYRPAMRPLEVGGDWYDVISLGRDRFGVVVGDCVGRGLDAAVTMGQLRSACRALLLRDAAPAQVLTDLDSFAEQVSGAACSTVFCAIIDVAAASIRYSSAGHPPGILAHPGGSGAELLDRATTVPLAVTARQQRAEATALLRSGSALLLYTDGLIERRGERLDLGIRAAAELLQQHIDGTPDELADRLVAGLVPAGGFADDSLVLTYRQAPARLRLNLPAEPASLAGMRQNLRRWLAASAVSPPVAGQVALAASEACSNAIEHAYRGDPSGQVRLTAELHGPRLDLVVADGSRWRPAAPDRGDRGHGLAMMRAFMADVVIEPTASGTTVRMSRDVR